MNYEQSSNCKLKELRKNRNLTLIELSDKIGISPTTLNRIEEGKKIPTLDVVYAITEALNLTKSEKIELLVDLKFIML